jgi:hypothetical protein
VRQTFLVKVSYNVLLHYCSSTHAREFLCTSFYSSDRHISGATDFKVENDADALVEIFKTVDLNGDKVMSWHEFTSFLAELVSQLSGSGVDSLLHFLPSRFEDETFHFRPVEYVKYLPGMDKVLVAERSVDFFKIYSKELRLIKECRGHTGGILCGMFFCAAHGIWKYSFISVERLSSLSN